MGNFVFSQVPVIKHSRSRFDLSHGVKTTGNVGTLYPFDVQEVVAGDTFKVRTSCVSRLASQFLRPVMDNLFLDVYWFYVPSRILYDKFVNVFGENTEDAWANEQEYEVPSLEVDFGEGPLSSGGRVYQGSVADYLGLPVSKDDSGSAVHKINVLPFRAFAKIYDDWFRDQNNVSPMRIQKGEVTSSESLSDLEWGPGNYCGLPPKVAKFNDVFTSALPAPQKGSSVDIPLATAVDVPVFAGDQHDLHNVGVHWTPLSGSLGTDSLLMRSSQGYSYSVTGDSPVRGSPLSFDNLWAQTSGLSFNPVTVNDLRFAFQYQKMLERDARSGTRFTEYLQAHFGVSSGDARLQRSEFLGGRRSPISIHQVTQTTGEGSDSSPLASVGAYSLSNSMSRFTKGFVEPGYVIGCFCIRQFHTYQQGIEKLWSKLKRVDFFDPVFSHIGEQPIMAKELFARAEDDRVFGYGEAYVDLRYRQSRVTAGMRSGSSASQDFWHFADYYNSSPVLGQQFIEEVPDYVDRAITVKSSAQNQFNLDFYIQNIAYRPLPTYSVPGLIDHD